MKHLFKMGAVAALALVSAAANATQIKATYAVDANTIDPGLQINTAGNAANPFSHDVAVGDSVTFDLFDIWTDENSLDFSFFSGCGNDCDPKPISVEFGFILPESGVGTVIGTTAGVLGLLTQKGDLSWGGPADFFYGANGDGHIQINLSDETFNTGLFGINNGSGHGATVEAELSLISDATVVDVPEPRIFALFSLALLGIGLASNRRRCGTRD